MSGEWSATAHRWEDSVLEALIVLAAGVVVSLFGLGYQCYELEACATAQTCVNVSHSHVAGFVLPSCSFVNHISMAGDLLYNATQDSYALLARGVCAPGERLHLNSITGHEECAPYRAWPSAFNTEIADPAATSDHDKACGKWIAASNTPYTWDMLFQPTYWSFYDDAATRAAILNIERTLFASSRLSSSELGKFYSMCTHTALGGNGAIRASAVQAYEWLVAQMPEVSDRDGALVNLGLLTGHYCNTPVLLGMRAMQRLVMGAMAGTPFAKRELATALFTLGENEALQALAEEANNLVQYWAYRSPSATMDDFAPILRGALGRSDETYVTLDMTPDLDGFLILLNESRWDLANAFLKGTAASCALALQSTLDSSLGVTYSFTEDGSLGRTAKAPDTPLLSELSNVTQLDATSTTWQKVRSRPAGDPATDCSMLVHFLFADRLDEIRFGLMVPDALYERLEHMVAEIRFWVEDTVQNFAPVASTILDSSTVAYYVRHTKIRIAGAPRGSWAGLQRGLVFGAQSSSDGVMLAGLKHARALFLDRGNAVADRLGRCEAGPVYSSLTSNAYVYAGGGDCSHLMLGLLKKPFSDVRYDNASLYSRLGYVVAHELAHQVESSTYTTGLVGAYIDSQHAEAMADIIAGAALIRGGFVSLEAFCGHVSQLWCARTPLGLPIVGDTHPGPNTRGDLLCATLRGLAF